MHVSREVTVDRTQGQRKRIPLLKKCIHSFFHIEYMYVCTYTKILHGSDEATFDRPIYPTLKRVLIENYIMKYYTKEMDNKCSYFIFSSIYETIEK